MFTRQHYEAIAKVIKNNITKETVSARLVCMDIASDLAGYFETDNPLFNRQKFLSACDQK